MKTIRTPLWDNLRFFLITCVVIGHFVEQLDSNLYKSIFLFIYSFHMPLFIFVSGLFHKNERVFQKIVSFIALYIMLKVLIFLIRLAFGASPVFHLFTENGLPWFMFALAVFILLTYLLRNTNLKFVLSVSILFACFAGYIKDIGDFLVLSRIIVFYPFYLLGVLSDQKKLESIHENTAFRVFSFVFLIFCALICIFFISRIYFFRSLFSGRNPFSRFSNNVAQYGALYRLLCYVVSLLTGFSVFMMIPGKPLGALTIWGSRTLQVFFWHRLFLYVLTGFGIHTALCASLVGKLAWIALAIALTILLSQKPFSFPTAQIMALPYIKRR